MRVLLLVFAIGCSHDHEVRVLDRDESPPSGWSVMPFDAMADDGTCVYGAGRVAFKRPERTTNLAMFTCYVDGNAREIGVTLRLPDEAWARAGWKRCSADREEAARRACREGAPR